jgi:16S rRNA (guanine527-N7)-methyltransferase
LLREKFETHRERLPNLRPEEIEQYEAYFKLLREWNEKIKLVSRKSIETSFAYHYADSLWICELAHHHLHGRHFSDLGTGAGFPGLIFAIRYPHVKVTLFEKLAKRRMFLRDVVENLGLSNVHLESALPEKKYKDLFTARAVFPVAELFPFMKRHLVPGGRLAVSLGGSTDLATVPEGFKLLSTHTYELPEDAGNRKLAIFEACST